MRSFSAPFDGSFPSAGLTLSAGMLYGVNGGGGQSNFGTIFKVGTNGTGCSVIHHFVGGSDGEYPVGRVVVSGNTIYGVMYRGGTNNVPEGGGTIYKVDTDGSNYSILRRLNSAINDGYKPASGMVLSGNFLYGTTTQGGVSSRGTSDRGTVFKINANGSGYQIIHAFSGYEDGLQPEAELTLIGNTLYGTAVFSQFGSSGPVLFKLGLDGSVFTVLYTFPVTLSVLGGNGIGHLTLVGNQFYGVGRYYQNNANLSSVFKIHTNGTVFQIIRQLVSELGISGSLTWTGYELLAPLTADSGTFDQIFQVKTNGTGFQILKTFSPSEPNTLVNVFALSGTTAYGVSLHGGQFNVGTVYSFDVSPKLDIASTGGGVKLTWPSYAQDYQLEQSLTLTSPSWTNVTDVPSDNGTNRTLTLPALISANAMFHRLRR
ncbi:MAG: choice-of-anchor tandem repeat GloVer-containing protein [Verrucomicrobiota bacterium]